jgi:hypothetical protein
LSVPKTAGFGTLLGSAVTPSGENQFLQ